MEHWLVQRRPFSKPDEEMKPAADHNPSPRRYWGLPSKGKRLARRVVSRVQYWRLRASMRGSNQKDVSAMIRIRDEEEFLYPAVKSIADCVDEIVLVDNLSTDRTPSVIESLRLEYPNKVTCYQYPYALHDRGKDHWELAAILEARSSPHLSHNYYNWCLRKCTKPYILIWDGDMIATDAFYDSIKAWRGSTKVAMVFKGANVHSDLQHLIAAKSSDRDALAASLTVPVFPGWVTSMTYTTPEPRLFPRFLATFEMGQWTHHLASPFLRGRLASHCCQRIEDVCYLHLKFCKRNPYTRWSPDFVHVISSNMTVGPPLSSEWRALLRHWQVDGRRA
jgi:glycosyltransferase involved in cell wall biosynthesis